MREVKCSASARARFGSSDKDSRGEGSGGVYREADQGTRVVHAAAGRGRSREEIQERAAASGRRQTETREGTAGQRSEHERSEHEGGSRGSASTIGKGADARSAEGRASASTIG